MKTPAPKGLYLAKNIEGLEKLISVNSSNKFSTRLAKKLYKGAQEDPRDEEKTYILLNRFKTAFLFLRTSEGQDFIDVLLGREYRMASDKVEELQFTLNMRYQEEVPGNVATSVSIIEADEQPLVTDSVFNNGKLFITCNKLYGILLQGTYNLLILETRSEEEFLQSHMKFNNCINIPSNCIQKGLTGHVLENKIPSASSELFQKRDTFDVIILVDWCTNISNYHSSKAGKLREILSEWDLGRTHKNAPVLLDGGFFEWWQNYPMYCTNKNVLYSKQNTDLDELLNLDKIEYPNFGEAKSNDMFRAPPFAEDGYEGYEIFPEEEMQLEEDGTTKLAKEEQNMLAKKEQLSHEVTLSGKNSSIGSSSNSSISETKDIDEEKELDHTCRTRIVEERLRILQEARQAKKPRTNAPEDFKKPIVDRATKPEELTSVAPIEGNLKYVPWGMTGLKNIKNTCYMNVILQCLRYLPPLIQFYCKGTYLRQIYRKPPVLANEMAHLVRALWSNNYSVIVPSELYDQFISYWPLFGKGRHEDCMEFFTLLFNFLHDDHAYEVEQSNSFTDRQKAWVLSHASKESFFVNNFYHQIKVDQRCKSCVYKNLKFEIENVFYVTIPENRSFTLEEVLANYLNSKEEYVCKRCQLPLSTTKTICRHPNVLVISLKRHVPSPFEGGEFYEKNVNHCVFPQDNLRLGNVEYRLVSVAMHQGTTEHGHYTAACRNLSNGHWYEYNDDKVMKLTARIVQKIGRKAYIFFYCRTDQCDTSLFSGQAIST